MSSRPPELLLFDAAGTLIEPAEPVARVYQRYFARHGWAAEELHLKRSFREIFAGLADPEFQDHTDGDLAERAWWRGVVRETAAAAGVEPEGEAFEECFADLFGHYAAGSAWAVFPEVRGVLEELKDCGFRMAVVSNFDRRLHRVLEELDLTRWFDLVLTSADVSARKPSPVLLQSAMRHLAVAPEHTRLVGDSQSADGGAAAAAGVEAFILNRPHTTLADFAAGLG